MRTRLILLKTSQDAESSKLLLYITFYNSFALFPDFSNLFALILVIRRYRYQNYFGKPEQNQYRFHHALITSTKTAIETQLYLLARNISQILVKQTIRYF